MKLGFFADGPWSHKALEHLINDTNFSINFICARFENPDQTLKKIAFSHNIVFLTNENVNSDYFLNKISKFNCDLFVSMSFNQIFKKRILNLPEKGVINCHAGKLPFYRGRNVLNWVLINDEKEFGVTTHFVDEGIDTGDIILQKVQKITDQDNYASLLHKAYKICSDLLYKSIKLIKNNDYKLISQKSIHPVGLYCIKRGIGDEVLNWNSTSRQVFNFVRAISDPGPIARSSINGNEIKIKKVELIKDAPYFLGFPGSVLNKGVKGIIVKTQDSSILITDWNCEHNLRIGDRLN